MIQCWDNKVIPERGAANYSAQSPRGSSLTSCNVQTNPDILIDPVEDCGDCGDQIVKLDVDLYSLLNPPIEENLLSASYQGKNIINFKEENKNDNQDLFSTKYKKDKNEECSINVSFYHQVTRTFMDKVESLQSFQTH